MGLDFGRPLFYDPLEFNGLWVEVLDRYKAELLSDIDDLRRRIASTRELGAVLTQQIIKQGRAVVLYDVRLGLGLALSLGSLGVGALRVELALAGIGRLCEPLVQVRYLGLLLAGVENEPAHPLSVLVGERVAVPR